MLPNTSSPLASAQTPLPYVAKDISALAKTLRAALASSDETTALSQVQMLNLLARAAGHRNFQSYKANPPQLTTADQVKDTAEEEPAVEPSLTWIHTDSEAAAQALSDHAKKALTQFDARGVLTRWPYKFSVQRVAMWGLWMSFAPQRDYTEAEVNAVLNRSHSYGDPVTLRRELINMKLLSRTPDCRRYWKEAQRPDESTQAFLQIIRQRRKPA